VLKHTYHILAPDLPEHGRSAAIKPFTIDGSAAAVADLIRTRASGKAHIVGISEGAQIIVALLASAPEVVDHAVVSSALVRQMPGMGWFSEPFWASTYRLIEPLNRYDWWIRLNMRSYGIPVRFLPEMRATYRSLTADAFVHLLVENQCYRLPDGLERVTSPTLVVGGKREYGVIRQSVKDIATAIPGAKGYLVHHLQRLSLSEEHNWNLSAPELFTQTVRAWIEGQPLPEELKPLQ
jgi:pimeloyl-ACP methyl ester carboxylesterase